MSARKAKRREAGRRVARLWIAVLAIVLAGMGTGSAHGTVNGFHDSFPRLGPLEGTGASDPWEIKRGDWAVEDISQIDGPKMTGANRVLVQRSRASNPDEPIAFVRTKSFRRLTVQVTGALLEGNQTKPVPFGASLGIVFRSSITDGEADENNMYIFTAVQVGVSSAFPTGKAFVLIKRYAGGYYLLTNKIAHTWSDLREPHDYKVVMGGGLIQCYVDGRLVIEHVDKPSGDTPTASDPLPGLPFDAGAVGLRTSATRAWFDDFTVIGNDAYEGRAQAFDAYGSGGVTGSFWAGGSESASRLSGSLGPGMLDTGYRYHDHGDFEDTAIGSFETSNGPFAGAELRVEGSGNGGVTSTARLLGVSAALVEPTRRVTVALDADSIETVARARCDSISSTASIQNGRLLLRMADESGLPEVVVGPFPLLSNYPPNTVIFAHPEVRVVANYQHDSVSPRRVEASALRIVFPETPVQFDDVHNPVNNQRLVPGRTVGTTPQAEIMIGTVTAGRYCSS